MNDKNQKDIIHNLEKCFLTKLKNFAKINEVNIIIDDQEIYKKRKSEIDNSQNVIELPPAIIRNNSIQLIDKVLVTEIILVSFFSFYKIF